jgi:hypothetical protein
MASSTDLREAIRNFVRYLTVSNESPHFTLSEEIKASVLKVGHRITRHINTQFAEFGYTVVRRFFREITGKILTRMPSGLRDEHPPPDSLDCFSHSELIGLVRELP